MFSFFGDIDNYEERKVANDVVGDAVIDTAAVSDGARPYETGVQHPEYNNGKWVIVEAYDTKAEAQAGHDRWVQIFGGVLPESLVDCGNSGISQLGEMFGMDSTYLRSLR